MKRAKLFAIALGSFIAAAPVLCNAQDVGWYIGGSFGNSESGIDEQSFQSLVASAGFGNTISGSDEKDSAFKVFAGYRFNRHFALEGGYLDLGSFSVTTRITSGAPPQDLTGVVETKDGLHLAGVGILPIGDSKFSVFGKAGLYSIKSTTKFNGAAGSVEAESDRKEDLMFGLGASYDFAKNFGVRVEYERFMDVGTQNNQGDIDLMSIGLVYRFQ